MFKRFTISHLLLLLMAIGVALSWLNSIRHPQVQDGYIWDETTLPFSLPAIPQDFHIQRPINFTAIVNHSYKDGADMYEKHYYQGWWNCRKDFYEKNEGFPYQEQRFSQIQASADALPAGDLRMHPMLAKRDGYRDCTEQIMSLVAETSADDFRGSLIQHVFPRIVTPIVATTCLLFFGIVVWHRNARKQGNGV